MNIINIVNELPHHATKTWKPRTAPIDCFCIHHSAKPPDITIEIIARYHVYDKDMAGIQYHYVIGADGVIYQTQPDNLFVWHAGAFNSGLGVCLLGNFMTVHPTPQQIASAKWLLAEKRREYGNIKLVGHKEAWDASTACPGATWSTWRGQLEEAVGSKLGVQVQNCKAIPGGWLQRHVREGNVTHALLIDPDVLSADPWPGVISMGRLWFKDDPDKAAIAKGAAGAREYIEMCKPRWAKCPWIRLWHPPNEPYTGNPHDPNDLDPMKRLAEFSVEMVRLGHIEGELMAVGALATGTPAGPPANPVPAIEAKWRIFAPAMHVADMLALHQYGMDTLEYTPENEWHIGTHLRAVPIMAEMGLTMPLVWVAEFFIDRAGNPNTDGWRVKLNGDEAEAMRQLAMRDADYARDPHVVAVTPFTWYDYNWPSFTITEGLSERIMAHRREVGNLPAPEPEPVGALVNGNFEGGFHYHNGINELYVPNGWTPFWAEPIAKWYGDTEAHYDFRPEYKRCGDETNGPKRSVSGFGAQWFTTYAGHRGGIYQQIAATPGQKVTAWASMMSWNTQVPYKPEVSMDEDWIPSHHYEKKIGIDPTGGTDWQSANIVWSATVEVNDAWFILATSAVAQSSTVTVFIYGAPKYAFHMNNCYVDNVGMTLGEPPVEPPVDIEKAIGDAIQQYIIPLNPTAALEKEGVARGLVAVCDEVRDVDGYVAQAFRSPDEREWQEIAYCADGDWGNVKWFRRAN